MLQLSDIGIPEMDGGFPVMESGKCTSTVRWMDTGATWTPLNNVRNSLVSGGWWLVAGCAAADLVPAAPVDTGTIPPIHTGEWWGPTLETMGQTLHLSCHSTFHHMLRPYCALYLTVWAALLIISYLYSVQLET